MHSTESCYSDSATSATCEKLVRLLHVEDDPDDALLLRKMLQDPPYTFFKLDCVKSLASALDWIDCEGVDLILLDMSLPDSRGLDTFTQVHDYAPDIPIIVLSGYGDEETAVKTVQKGAQDYLVKGELDGRQLVRSLRYALERHRGERELTQERDLLETLLSSIPDRIYFKDPSNRFLRLSHSVSDYLRLRDPSEALGKTDFDFFTNEKASLSAEDELRIMQTGEPLVGVVEKDTMLDGRISWSLTTKAPLRHKDGPITGTFGVSKDITQIVHMQEELDNERSLLRRLMENQRNLLRRLIDSLPDHIYVKDMDCRFTLGNSAVASFLSLASPERLVGRMDSDFFPEAEAEKYLAEDKAVLSGNSRVNRVARMTNSAGVTRWVLTTKLPLKDRNGVITGLIGINRDISDRKEACDQLYKMNDDLLRILSDLEKSHDELKAAQLCLIHAEKMELTGRLAAGVAHEVKNPLAVALMCVEVLKQSMDANQPEISSTLQNLDDAIQRADGVVRGLLDFSAPRELDLQPEDLNKVVEQSLQYVKHDFAKKHISVVKRLAKDLPPVPLDSNKIKQVFVNLMVNAAHAMPNKGCLTVTTFSEPVPALAERLKLNAPATQKADALALIVQIEDTGSGIPEENIKSIFEPFFTTKAPGEGTGLGLPVCKQIVDLHGGLIDIRNGKNGGACATLALILH